MKKLIILSLLLTQLSYASGKFMIQGNRNSDTNTYERYSIPLVGLAIYQPLKKGVLAYNAFAGTGEQDFLFADHKDVRWWAMKNDLDIMLGRLTISPGFTFKYVEPYNQLANDVHVKASLKLWD